MTRALTHQTRTQHIIDIEKTSKPTCIYSFIALHKCLCLNIFFGGEEEKKLEVFKCISIVNSTDDDDPIHTVNEYQRT